ncbi:PEP-CTERM protein-sorting domain-containing protein/MYXO-CTERM domain-containing protein [Lutimaribacter pacificus]|uniref:PEP-CTERM protein-sorting domain-containing protein/MYXO-CTERM domain-containing protein n=2 Tax=Lutimaribacter pacificus TaxID=391948 RepID=A0A1H0G0M9_9RHOB|nr:PEP-CTERM protein-sorting domain-containing protein/MYXO-CTERM domain-containing protein [Lutimaribacter pacificus]SHJ83650.1 PEP-CTERM protein-sorting domain-containing protein/MYXO-CTERM domain-containing protein [Lutimaribacter pacificus]
MLILAGLAAPSLAAPVAFTVSGKLSDDGLSVNDAFDNATFRGSVTVDTASVKTNISHAITYNLISYYVAVTPVGVAPSLTFLSDGEPGEDDSGATVQLANGDLSFLLYENIDNPATPALERGRLQLGFSGGGGSGGSGGQAGALDGPLAAAPGPVLEFDNGELQFSPSETPTTLESADADVTPAASPVPVPATAGLLAGALGLFGAFAARRRRNPAER